MSILMSSMSSFSHYDPFNTQSYLFENNNNNQEHYLQPATAFSPNSSYATPPHPFPVDPRWFNTSFSGHATSPAPHLFSPMTHSVITPPQLQTDLLSLSPSSTIAPIPPLSGSRNRSRSMSNRIRSFNPRPPAAARPSSGSARGPQNQRIARRSTVSSSSPSHQHPSPIMGMQSSPSTTSYLHSPTMEHEAPDSHETRASKRRRTDDVDSASLHSYSTVPEPPHLLTPTQPPHLALLQQHGYPPSQTWAGPPSAGHIPHGLSPDHHGYTQWPPAPLAYFTPDQGLSDHHHHHQHQLHQHQLQHQHHQLSATSDASHTPILPYPSPTVAGPGFFNSPEPEAPVSAVSTHFQFHKMEPDSPRLLEDVQPSFNDSFEHGPTEFPPRAYPGGVDAKSPWVPTKPVGKIFGSRLEQVSFSFFSPLIRALVCLTASPPPADARYRESPCKARGSVGSLPGRKSRPSLEEFPLTRTGIAESTDGVSAPRSLQNVWRPYLAHSARSQSSPHPTRLDDK
jgi:hypothetical protein